MHSIRSLTTFCAGLFLFMACTIADKENPYLQMATGIVDDHPQEALQLLDSIASPLSLDKKNYMGYIVTLTQARYMDYQDITDDVQILVAQRYFVDKDNLEMAARASYYSAAYWYDKGDEDKALACQLLANDYARQAGNHLFQAKSAHWLGNMYYDREKLDSAKIYFRQAQELYPDRASNEMYQLEIKYMLGATYLELEQLDEALESLDEGIETAQRLNEQLYVAQFIHLKGYVLLEKREYQQAKTYFDQALTKEPEAEDSLRIYLSYAVLYKYTNRPDSTKYYLDLVKKRMDEISYSRIREWAFEEFEHEFLQRLKRRRLLKTIYDTRRSFK